MLIDQYNETQEIDSYERYSNIHESRTIFSIKIEKEIFKKGNIYFENQYINWRNQGFNPQIPYMKKKYLEKFSLNLGFDSYISLDISKK